MKKSSFIEGAMISTIGIILCKILGLFYVIPFYAIIGSQGGALYSYAYSIYNVFLSLSIGGIPIAISKIVSEYNALKYYNTKERAFKLGYKIIVFLGLLSFVLLFLFAPLIAHFIIGSSTGGNSVKSVTLVIRVISLAIIVVPALSVKRGYLQGHKIMSVPSLANVLEQLVRVIVIIVASFIALKVFKWSVDTSVALALTGATLGAIVGYLYVDKKINSNKDNLNTDVTMTRAERSITDKVLIKKILAYAIPFIVIDLIKSAYAMVDTFTVVKTLTKIGISVGEAENVIGIITTWGNKLNMIVISISMGLTVSLIPNIASSFAKHDIEDVSKKLGEALEFLVLIVLPMTIGLSVLALPVWTIFYGYDFISANLFSVFIFQALSYSLFSVLINTVQTMNNTKEAISTLLVTFLLKCILNIPCMYLFSKIGLTVAYAPIILTILIQSGAVIYLLYRLNKKYKINYTNIFSVLIKIVLSSLIMLVVLKLLNLFISINDVSRFICILKVLLFTVVGALVYFAMLIYSKTFKEVFGSNSIKKLLRIIKK